MFPWASKDYVLDLMSWDQVVYYYNNGWEAKQTEAKVHWGTYGMLMSGENPDKPGKNTSDPTIEEIRRYPGYENAYFNEKGKLIKG